MSTVVAILGLVVLMIVHEGGHYLAARAFGLRVIKFSIGFGPTFFKIQPEDGYFYFTAFGDRVKFRLFAHDPERHGPTIYQAAMIPFFAFVQVAGMNPFEDNDPDDKGSYANASLLGRISTIIAGPLANYVFASVFFFVPAYFDGVPVRDAAELAPAQVIVQKGSPAEQAGLQTKDKILSVGGAEVTTWEGMANVISGSEGKVLPIVIDRAGETLTLEVTPKMIDQTARSGVSRYAKKDPTLSSAALFSVVEPAETVKRQLLGIAQVIRGKSEAKLGGAIGLTQEMSRAVEHGWADFVLMLGGISSVLAALNLLPIPALDGGRLLFLSYEATTRKRPNATVEAQIHAVGFVLLLGLSVYVMLANDLGLGGSK